ncbi:MAG: hypothetical protein FGF48_02205 [Candidatus Brockarchaeota archaeon]|nr:hypothetical protein [Candidatus Brockarchaeota archaeon]
MGGGTRVGQWKERFFESEIELREHLKREPKSAENMEMRSPTLLQALENMKYVEQRKDMSCSKEKKL